MEEGAVVVYLIWGVVYQGEDGRFEMQEQRKRGDGAEVRDVCRVGFVAVGYGAP